MTASPSQSSAQPPVSIATTGGQLRVAFHWLHDRYVHQIVVRDQWRIASIEGTPDDPWPPSPPLQQLSLEQIDGRDVILGVGAAGQCHWSISVESYDDEGIETLKFDLACRCRSEPKWLGSTYEDSQHIDVRPLDHCELNLDDSGRVAISPLAPAEIGPATRRWSFAITPNSNFL